MTKHVLRNLILTATLTLALSTSEIAQTSANSTPANPSTAASPDVPKQLQEIKTDTAAIRLATAERQVSRLIGEVKAGRTLTAEQSATITALEERLSAEMANSASLEKSYDSAVREIDSLRKALDFADVALAAKDQTIAVLKDQRDEARRNARKANKRAAFATAVAVGLTLLKFLVK